MKPEQQQAFAARIDAARKAQKSAVVSVPLEPTEKMVNAGFAQIVREGVSADSVRAIYRAMLSQADREAGK